MESAEWSGAGREMEDGGMMVRMLYSNGRKVRSETQAPTLRHCCRRHRRRRQHF